MLDNPDTYRADIPRDIANAAHRGTSFSPEDRGDSEIGGYCSQLALDYIALSKYADTDEKVTQLIREWPRYREGYRERTLAMLGAKSRCMSTMITGGSNFPTRRNQKRSDAADNRTRELIEFRTRAIDAIRKVLQPELRPVMAGDSDASDRLEDKIEAAELRQAHMKAVNEIIRATKKDGQLAQFAALLKGGIGEALARELLKPDFMGRVGYASYELTNNNANIRRMKGRLASVTEAKATPTTEAEGSKARYEDCPPENRVRLFFPGKPDVDTRNRLKSAGFRWAPTVGAWQAYRNGRSLEVARREAGISDGARPAGWEPANVIGEVV